MYHPTLATGSAPIPGTLGKGPKATFTRAVIDLIPGEGLVRWAPGNDLLSSWDYIAETD